MKKIIIGVFALMMPLIAAAVEIKDIVGKISTLLGSIIPVLELIAVAVFIYGIVRFIYAGGNENERKEAKNYIIYGLIGIFVLVAFWGIIQIVINTFFEGAVPNTMPIPVIPNI